MSLSFISNGLSSFVSRVQNAFSALVSSSTNSNAVTSCKRKRDEDEKEATEQPLTFAVTLDSLFQDSPRKIFGISPFISNIDYKTYFKVKIHHSIKNLPTELSQRSRTHTSSLTLFEK